MAALYGFLSRDGQLSFVDEDARLISMTGDDLTDLVRGRFAIVFVPPSDVSVQIVTLNSRNERDARRAAPYAIEEELAQSPEQVHVALSSEMKTGGRTICAVRDDVMTVWMKVLDEAGLSDAALCVPQTLLMQDGIVSGPQGIFGRRDDRYFSLDEDAPEDWRAGLIESGTEDSQYRFGDDHSAYAAQLIDWYKTGNGIDLRQGPYTVRTPLDLDRLKRWRVAGALAAVLGLAWIGSAMWSVQNLDARVTELEQRALQVVEAGWPELGGDIDRALREIQAGGGRGQAAFPSAMTATAALYDAVGEIDGSELRSLRYDRDRGQVLAIVAYRDFADGNRLASVFEGSGLRARVGDARQSGAQVVAELVLEVGS